MTVLLIITGMILAGVFTATLTTLMTGEENEEFNVMQQNVDNRLSGVEKTQEEILGQLKLISGKKGSE